MTALLLGAGDACLNTQIISLLGGAYRERSAEAFSLMKLVQSVGIAGGFSLFTSVGLYWQLLLLQLIAVASTAAFCWVGRALRKTEKKNRLFMLDNNEEVNLRVADPNCDKESS